MVAVIGEKYSLGTRKDWLFNTATNLSVCLFVLALLQLEGLFFSHARELEAAPQLLSGRR